MTNGSTSWINLLLISPHSDNITLCLYMRYWNKPIASFRYSPSTHWWHFNKYSRLFSSLFPFYYSILNWRKNKTLQKNYSRVKLYRVGSTICPQINSFRFKGSCKWYIWHINVCKKQKQSLPNLRKIFFVIKPQEMSIF